MPKWFDDNGTDVDAYPDRAFRGGVYEVRKVEYPKINPGDKVKVIATMSSFYGLTGTARPGKGIYMEVLLDDRKIMGPVPFSPSEIKKVEG